MSVTQQEPYRKVILGLSILIPVLIAVLFRVKIEGEEGELLSYLSGKMRLHRIRVLVGDKVLLVLEPYGGKARIIKRL